MDFVMSGVRFARDISVSSYILHLFPKFMKPCVRDFYIDKCGRYSIDVRVSSFRAVAWFATMPNRRHSAIAMKYLQPLIQQRLNDMVRKKDDPTFAYEEPVSHEKYD